mmetsp:Transcript_13792/g.17994  ORF Transcript_13792/g.17994 Transcript_13792/m.17994 type:complete len:112 (+) Transcript_13792:3137-3472(+)
MKPLVTPSQRQVTLVKALCSCTFKHILDKQNRVTCALGLQKLHSILETLGTLLARENFNSNFFTALTDFTETVIWHFCVIDSRTFSCCFLGSNRFSPSKLVFQRNNFSFRL